MKSLILMSLWLWAAFTAAQAETCRVGCTVRYQVDLGSFSGEGRNCAEADAQASLQCRAQGGFTTTGSCASTPERAVYVRQCRRGIQESILTEFPAASGENFWSLGKAKCEEYCRAYGSSDEGVSCHMGGVACTP